MEHRNDRGQTRQRIVWLAGASLLLGCMGATPLGTDTDDLPMNGNKDGNEEKNV